jgi:hypothetical protein
MVDISIIWGGFFKRPKANGFCLIRDKCFALGTLFLTKWEAVHFGGKERVTVLLGRDGPNGVHGVLGCGGKVAEGLAVIEPRLSSLGGGVRVVGDNVFIRLLEEGVPLGAEFF